MGDEVGYMVKGDTKASGRTRILFCTYGVMLRRLQSDPSLTAIDYIILDEVHERGIESDFCLALLVEALARRSKLKIILMSATIATDKFASYLGKELHLDRAVPTMFIPGFTFPVEEFYKKDYEEIVRSYNVNKRRAHASDDYDDDDGMDGANDRNNAFGRRRKGDLDYELIVKLIYQLANGLSTSATQSYQDSGKLSSCTTTMLSRASGSILIFLPGVPEINRLLTLVKENWQKTESSPELILISLHGNTPPSEQKNVFINAPRGKLKIVAATNVAEASITIPDATVVIDTCKVKEMGFDAELQTSGLMTKFAAKDSLQQRRGRAGRVQKGRCFRLITKNTFDKLPFQSTPEILRSPLERVVLQLKAMMSLSAESDGESSRYKSKESLDCLTILRHCPDCPSEDAIRASEYVLMQLQAINADSGRLTSLGQHLAALPCSPRTGRLLIFGALLSCVYTSSIVAAAFENRSPFIISNDPEDMEKIKAAKVSIVVSQHEHVALL